MNVRALILVLAFPTLAVAGEEPTQAVPAPVTKRNLMSLDVMGFSGFAFRYVGDFGLLYERTVGERHGLVLQGGFAHVHGHPTHISLGSARLGYRFHFLPGRAIDPFVGVLVGARFGGGRYDHVDPDGGHGHAHPYSAFGFTSALHLGVRWSVTSWFAVSSRVGVSANAYALGCDGKTAELGLACEDARTALGRTPIGVDTELGAGFLF